MLSGEKLLDTYKPRAVLWREMILLPSSVALAFVDDCEQKDIRLLGMDGFDPPAGESIRCRLEDCLDVSGADFWDYSVAELCQVIRDFIISREDLVYEFAPD